MKILRLRSLQVIATAVLALQVFAAQAEVSVQGLADKWSAAYNSHNQSSLGQLYTQDAHLYLHGSPRIEGRDDIEVFWGADFTEGNPITVLTVTHSVDGLDMVLVHGNYEVIDRETGVKLGFGRFAHIWITDDKGEWQLDRDLWNQPYTAVGE